MAKKSAKPGPKKLAGKKFAFAGKFGYGPGDLDALKKLAKQEGAKVVDGDKVAPDYLVEGAGVNGKSPAAVAKIQKKHPAVQVIDEATFYQLTNPTPEEMRQLMLSTAQDRQFWHDMQNRLYKAGVTIDLSGSDFRKCKIEGTLYKVDLDGSDFRGATISASFDNIKGAKFDGATMSEGSFSHAQDCSLKNVTMEDVRWNPAEFVRCDFSGATLKIETGSFTQVTGCKFKKADLSEAELDQSTFESTDFTGAKLVRAKLEKCNFTNSDLTGADLTAADLRNVKFTGANLTKAKFKDAILCSADFTGATIEGADFSGANVSGADFTGIDTSQAKNLVIQAARQPGPNMRALAKLANASKKLRTSIELELDDDEHVTLYPSTSTYAGRVYAHAQYSHEHRGRNVDAPSFEQGMLNLTELWSRGAPDFDTVKVEAEKCSLRGKELHELALLAWYEACGLQPPTAEQRQQVKEQTATTQASLRDVLIAELHGGAAGVAQWNARSGKERGLLGRYRKQDFSQAMLAGVNLDVQDLEGCTFAGANLKNAGLQNAQLKGASFANATMTGAILAGAKCSDASFVGAKLNGKCNLCAANFRRGNFQGADLTGAEFDFSDLFGADFSTANLKGVSFDRAKFDETTAFPPGFVPPRNMLWKGAGPRPGTPAAPPPPASGTLDFAAFLEQLHKKVDEARMQKAGSMLKAESFQLFAEVKDDSLTGVVKSQSSDELVYSCRLTAAGAFGCCTQNLRHCGGLRGALCKHLLVLIIGLAKAGQLDSATVNHWIELSKRNKPAIDEDEMSATFLRYKGAEAGEVDWRPTETIPEDFYAM